MNRILTILTSLFIFAGTIMAQSMSDEQVIAYVKTAQQQGKSQKEMTTELLARGVTKDQVERIKAKYEATQGGESRVNSVEGQKRERSTAQEEGLSATNFDEIGTSIQDPTQGSGAKRVFGRNVFTGKNLTFEPNINLATPENYKLGPGDEVIIDVWGASENSIRQTISPEGSISVSTLGPVYLSGLTVKQANEYLQQEFSKIYSGISGNTSQVNLTLGQIRTIQINMLGDVALPGTYRLSAFSTLFHALYRAGGVSPIGSLRDIQVIRNGKKIAEVDVYDYLLNGKMKDDIRLMENDVILVSPYKALVDISGKVKRPMYYEIKKGETIADILNYAGGFTGDAYAKAIRVLRMSGREKQIYNVDDVDFANFQLMDEDALNIGAILDRYENRAEIKGAVYRDGMYQINGKVNTVLQLIEKAEGLRGDAFLNRAQLQRENDDLTLTLIPLDLQGMMNGNVADIELQRNDVLYIPSIHDITSEGTLSVFGHVARPGTFVFAKNMTIEDLVLKAGGLTDAASTARVDVARRVKNTNSTSASPLIGQTFRFDFNNGYLVGDGQGFELEPYDQVYIRKSPGYHTQQDVAIGGEILFPGKYALNLKNERISNLIEKAGNITPEAFVDGARLIRKMTPEEVQRRGDVMRLAKSSTDGGDSISVDKLDLNDFYAVGINLAAAIKNPGGDADLVLREGDILYIPTYNNTVKINGEVMHPNTVSYNAGKKLGYYINQAGGYANRAKKSKAFVIYMNGTVSKLKGRTAKKIKPGCEIIIPSKPQKNRMSTGEIMGISSTSASMAAIVASMINLFK